jgi:hypothetical protein
MADPEIIRQYILGVKVEPNEVGSFIGSLLAGAETAYMQMLSNGLVVKRFNRFYSNALVDGKKEASPVLKPEEFPVTFKANNVLHRCELAIGPIRYPDDGLRINRGLVLIEPLVLEGDDSFNERFQGETETRVSKLHLHPRRIEKDLTGTLTLLSVSE